MFSLSGCLSQNEINEAIFSDLPDGKFEDSTRSVSRHNLPRALPEFIGRNKELQWIYAKCVSKESHGGTPVRSSLPGCSPSVDQSLVLYLSADT